MCRGVDQFDSLEAGLRCKNLSSDSEADLPVFTPGINKLFLDIAFLLLHAFYAFPPGIKYPGRAFAYHFSFLCINFP